MEEATLLSVIRWVVFAVACAAFLWIASGNLWIVLRAVLWHKPSSRAFLLGGLVGMFALWVASFELFERYWWVPLVVDAGSLPLVAHTILFFLLGRRFRESRRKWLLIGACLVGTCLGGVLIALAAILLLEMCGFTGISDKDWAAGIAGGILVVGVLFFFRPFKRARRVGEDHENGT